MWRVPAGVVEMLPSLLDFRPEAYGLPPFEDRVCGALLLDPVWRMKGTVVKGFGRGSKVRSGPRSISARVYGVQAFFPLSLRCLDAAPRDLVVPQTRSFGSAAPRNHIC